VVYNGKPMGSQTLDAGHGTTPRHHHHGRTRRYSLTVPVGGVYVVRIASHDFGQAEAKARCAGETTTI
jgi:hypothetical protein